MGYLNYFFFLWFNWNFSIARRILREEVVGERKYNLHTTGYNNLNHLRNAGPGAGKATIYMPASYGLLENVFQKITPSSYRHFIDIGCGRGRAMCVAAHYGFKKITGIELSTRLKKDAEKNVKKTLGLFQGISIHLILEDANFYPIPGDADCLFMFNPFDEVVLKNVLENISASFNRNPRSITLIYLNSIYKNLLKEYGFDEVEHHQEMEYLQYAIYIKNALPKKGI